jgi:hypothetical protein
VDILLYFGIPAAFTSFLFGIFLFLFKREMNKRDRSREEKEKNTEQLMLLTLHNTRAISILATATAKAVQRIPDAHCNGDMTAALEEAAKIQKEEKDFLFDQGVKHIFGDQ